MKLGEYCSQEVHEKFLDLFKDTPEFEFHPEPTLIAHYIELENTHYTKLCMIRWLESSQTPNEFTKKDCFLGIGLQKPNEPFEKFWSFLTAPRSTGHYMGYDKAERNWVYFN